MNRARRRLQGGAKRPHSPRSSRSTLFCGAEDKFCVESLFFEEILFVGDINRRAVKIRAPLGAIRMHRTGFGPIRSGPSLQPQASDLRELRKRLISSKNRLEAGSCSRNKWFRPGKTMKRAPGMPAANWRPASRGVTTSSRTCMTSVGAFTLDRRSVTSKSPTTSKYRAAHSGEVVFRHSSLK
jgi:hypothetical protein